MSGLPRPPERSVTDITERKAADERLRGKESELQQILDLTPQLIAVFGPRRERLFVNRMALDYFGLTLDEWRNTAHGALGHPNDTKRVQSQWDRAMSSGSAFEIEVRMRKADGTFRWFLNRYNPLRNDEEQVLRWYVACTDIEDRKRAEDDPLVRSSTSGVQMIEFMLFFAVTSVANCMTVQHRS